jgi:hypothetical protein
LRGRKNLKKEKRRPRLYVAGIMKFLFKGRFL